MHFSIYEYKVRLFDKLFIFIKNWYYNSFIKFNAKQIITQLRFFDLLFEEVFILINNYFLNLRNFSFFNEYELFLIHYLFFNT